MSKLNQQKLSADTLCQECEEIIQVIEEENNKNLIEMFNKINKNWVNNVQQEDSHV